MLSGQGEEAQGLLEIRPRGSLSALERPLRVLVVDDDASTRAGVGYYLREMEAPATVVGEAGDGPEAIERARALHPDLVIMDARMRGMSGFAATRVIREDLPETQVVILSLYDDEFARADAELAGALDFVAKTDLPALSEVIARVHAQLLS